MNKSGSILDIIYILVSIFVFVFVTIVMSNFYDSYKEAIAEDPVFNNTHALYVQEQATLTLNLMDYTLLFLILGFIILVVVSSFSIRTHPLFFFISIMLLSLVVLFAALFSNVYTEIIASPNLDDSNYTVIPFLMNHLPTVILIIGCILVIILYAKSKWEEY